jgi:hypothetical protein
MPHFIRVYLFSLLQNLHITHCKKGDGGTFHQDSKTGVFWAKTLPFFQVFSLKPNKLSVIHKKMFFWFK